MRGFVAKSSPMASFQILCRSSSGKLLKLGKIAVVVSILAGDASVVFGRI